MKDMITEDKQSLVIFRRGIEIDRTLPKHVRIDDDLKKKQEERRKKRLEASQNGQTLNVEEGDSDTPVTSDWVERHESLKRGERFDALLGLDVKGINVLMGERLRSRIFEPDAVGENARITNLAVPVPNVDDEKREIPAGTTVGFFKRFLSYLSRNSGSGYYGEKMYSLDVLEFFAEVKGIIKNSPEAERYIDRTAGYIEAIQNADLAGQNALKERLLGGLIMNKYESVLHAIGKYYVIGEEDVVNFAKKTPKGLALDYVKNYVRPIPTEVINEIGKMNELEIFDNYVILHYDPQRKSFEETFKEKERRRDPILFGVIKGSKKLYYITDWVDEYCDLTLDKFVETLQRNKETFKMKEAIDIR